MRTITVKPFELLEKLPASSWKLPTAERKAMQKVLMQGFVVEIAYLPGGDEMFEVLTHPAVFETQPQAMEFADRVQKVCGGDLQGLNLARWRYEGHNCSPVFKESNRPDFFFVPFPKP